MNLNALDCPWQQNLFVVYLFKMTTWYLPWDINCLALICWSRCLRTQHLLLAVVYIACTFRRLKTDIMLKPVYCISLCLVFFPLLNLYSVCKILVSFFTYAWACSFFCFFFLCFPMTCIVLDAHKYIVRVIVLPFFFFIFFLYTNRSCNQALKHEY